MIHRSDLGKTLVALVALIACYCYPSDCLKLLYDRYVCDGVLLWGMALVEL